jgi:hypothetical protein
VPIFSLGRIEFILKGPDLVAVPNGYNQRFFLGENIHSFAIFSFCYIPLWILATDAKTET